MDDEYDLLTAIKKIKSRRCNFVLYKGEESNQLLISPKRIKAKEAAELLAEKCGKIKPYAKGVCYQVDGGTVFATKAEPPKMLSMLLLKVLKANRCLKFLPFDLRQLKDDETDEVDSADESENTGTPDTGAPDSGDEETGATDALGAWTAARSTAVDQLKAIAQAIGKSKDPDAMQALIQIKAMIANLTPKPSGKNAVAELQRYLATDELVEDIEAPNPWGIKVELRKPLLTALATLAKAF